MAIFCKWLPFALLSISPVHRCSRCFLFLEKVIASLALQDLDRIHEVGDLHQRNWSAIEACLVSDLRPAGFGKPSAFLVLGSFSWSWISSPVPLHRVSSPVNPALTPWPKYPGPGYLLLPMAWARPPPVLPIAPGPLPPHSWCLSCVIPLNHVVETLPRPNRSLLQLLHPPAARLKIQRCFLGEPPYPPALPAGPELFQLGSQLFSFLLFF